MKYTSLSHWNTGHNVQQNWNSVEEWQDYCIEDSSVVWSKLFISTDGGFIGEYPERLQQSSVMAVPLGYVQPYVIEKGLDGFTATINPISEGKYTVPVFAKPSPRITDPVIPKGFVLWPENLTFDMVTAYESAILCPISALSGEGYLRMLNVVKSQFNNARSELIDKLNRV